MNDTTSASPANVALPTGRQHIDHCTAEDIEGSCPVCDAFAIVDLTAGFATDDSASTSVSNVSARH